MAANSELEEIRNLSLAALERCAPDIAESIEMNFAKNFANVYQDFVGILYKALDGIISKLQENPELRKNDHEDRLTIEIVTCLRTSGWKASHDTKIGGHTDITVTNKNGDFTWIGEAKIDRGNNYIFGGFLQLITRYSIGVPNQSHGALIVYIKDYADAQSRMIKWRKYLNSKKLNGYEDSDCNANPLAFFSRHTHEKSGLPFTTRHIPVLLYFEPDK